MLEGSGTENVSTLDITELFSAWHAQGMTRHQERYWLRFKTLR